MNITTKALSLCTLLVVSITGQAGPEKESDLVHTITNPFPHTFGNRFSESVALSRDGKTLLVGAATEDCAGGPDCGAAYVYRLKKGEWLQEARLAASDETPNAQFGGWDRYDKTVALSKDGNTALVAAVNGANSCSTGSVYVFVRQDGIWRERQKLTLPEDLLLPIVRGLDPVCGIEIDQFGRSVALSDDGRTAIVGATNQGIPGIPADTGAAYVFQREEGEWIPTARLTGSQTVFESVSKASRLGSAVALSGNGHTALVGAAAGFPSAVNVALSGAYVFKRDGDSWTEVAILRPLARLNRGASVALSHNGYTALVGSGRPIVFQGTEDGNWTEEATLGVDLTGLSQFGFALDINKNGHTAVVGDWGVGTAHTFTRHENDDGSIEWKSQLALDCAQLGCSSILGSSVAISGNAKTLFVGYVPGGFGSFPPCPGGGLCNNVFGLERK